MPKYAGIGYCKECGQEVDIYFVDNGIGAYEYWGAKGTDHKWEPECALCGAYTEDFEEVENDI